MPKGKILMGKRPKPGPVKPSPKGGKAVNRKIEDSKNIKGGNVPYLPGKPSDLDKAKMPSFLRKKKPVQPRRGGK